MRVLAVGAHPDDIEVYAGGTVAKCAERGDTVILATATNGNIGSVHHTMEEIATIRKNEAKNSAEIIGAEYICLDYDDEMFFEDKSVRLAFIDLVRYANPDIILTHYPEDYNPCHELTSKIISDIAIMGPIPKLVTSNPPTEKIPRIYYWEPVHGIRFQPTEYVDITKKFDKKKEMLSQHRSQMEWMTDLYKDNYKEDTSSFFDMITITSLYRGMQAGVKYAEGFVRALDAFRITTTRDLP